MAGLAQTAIRQPRSVPGQEHDAALHVPVPPPPLCSAPPPTHTVPPCPFVQVETAGQRVLVGISVTFMMLIVIVPFINVFFQAFGHGFGPFIETVQEPDFQQVGALPLVDRPAPSFDRAWVLLQTAHHSTALQHRSSVPRACCVDQSTFDRSLRVPAIEDGRQDGAGGAAPASCWHAACRVCRPVPPPPPPTLPAPRPPPLPPSCPARRSR